MPRSEFPIARPRHPRPASHGPRITRRWVETAVVAHRAAFEEEMARHRRSLDREVERFWRARQADE